jgi:hypothetical protein
MAGRAVSIGFRGAYADKGADARGAALFSKRSVRYDAVDPLTLFVNLIRGLLCATWTLQIQYHAKCLLYFRRRSFATVPLPFRRPSLKSYRHSVAACVSWLEPFEELRLRSVQYASDAR